MSSLQLWTDGACEPNPGIGGWGYLVVDRGRVQRQGCGGDACTTNNRMEMVAIIEGLRALAGGAGPLVMSDSRYCVNGCTVWRRRWQKRGYRRGSCDMLNADLWRELHAEADRTFARFQWVRGHSGIRLNERADRLAAEGRAQALFSERLVAS